MVRFEKIIGKTAYALSFVGVSCICFLVLFSVTNVVGRRLFNYPLLGNLEIGELAMATIVFLCIAYTQFTKLNVKIDLVAEHLPKRVQAVLDTLTLTVSLLIWVLITWQGTLYATSVLLTKQTTDALNIPLYPFVYLVTIGGSVLCLCLLLAIYENLRAVKSKTEGGKQ